MSNSRNQWIEKYGPWALITGASDGIGREMARDVAARGLNVVLVARRADRLNDLAQGIESQFSVKTHVIIADLSLAADVDRLIVASDKFDIGLLISAAGYGTSGAFIKIDGASELNMLDLNCRANLALTHHFAKRLVSRDRGGIILFGSLVGFQGVPYSANYAATKAYIQILAEGLHRELKVHGVDVLSVAPGPVHTGFAARSGMKLGLAAKPDDVARQGVAALGRTVTKVPGLQAKVLMASLALLPRFMKSAIMGRIMKSMTKHDP